MSEQPEPIDYSKYTSKTLEELRKDQTGRFPDWKSTDSEKSYWDKIRSLPDPHAPAQSLSDAMRNMMKVHHRDPGERSPISFDDAKQILWAIILQDQQQRGYKYEFSDHLKSVIPDMILYFIGDPSGKLDTSKGLYLWGNVGRGKTQLFQFFSVFTKAIKFNQFDITSSKKIVYDISKESSTAGLEYYFTRCVCFDDLGFEEKGYKHFGNELKVMETILEQRYNKRIRTHATSNVPPDQLHKFYDERIVSRCSEIFNFVKIDGVDHRKEK